VSAGTDPSPVDGEDSLSPDVIREVTHSRLAHTSSPCRDVNLLHQRQLSYPYSLDEMNGQQLDNRSSYSTSTPKRLGQNLTSAPPRHSARFSETLAQSSYHPPRGSAVQAGSQSHAAYFADRHAVWDSIGAEHPAQLSAASWSGNQERVLTSGSVGRSAQNHCSLPQRQGLPSSHHPQSYSFPTLNSPFFPNPSHVQSTFQASDSLPSGSSSTHYTSSSLESLAPRPSERQLGTSYDQCGYDLSPSFCSSATFSRDAELYGEQARSSRALQAGQTASSYAHSIHLVSPIASGSSTASNLSYLKDRLGG
jgi:hypothetical protein